MRTGSILFLTGIILLIQFPHLPPVSLALTLPLILILMYQRRSWRWPACFLCGFLWALLRADIIVADRLDPRLEGELLTVEGRVGSLPVFRENVVRFDYQVNRITDLSGNEYHNPRKIRLNWYRTVPDLSPGETWRLSVKLKRPNGFMNPGGFDYEGFLFQEGIGATGYVVDRETNVRLSGASRGNLHHIRFQLREKIHRLLENSPMQALVIGLAIGDRSSMAPDQWRVLARTGTSHLLAISGLHIGLVATLVFAATRRLRPVLGAISSLLSGQRLAAVCAAIAATVYAAMAGFSIPTQRALIMVAVVLLLAGTGRLARGSNIIVLALIIILLIDPFSVMSAGFWLSFSAIVVILYGMGYRINIRNLWWRWGQVQWLVAVGLMPLLLIWFQQIPLLGIPANLIAVPWVSMLSVPLILTGIASACIHERVGGVVLDLGAATLELLWNFLEQISRFDTMMLQTPHPAVPGVCAALVGAAILLLPRGMPARWLGIIWMLPALLPSNDMHQPLKLRFVLLDVGQGLAAVVHTGNHTLLYDAGPKYSDRFDAGEDVILPYLQYRGVSRIDKLIASHGDSDHIGGLPHILAGIDVVEVITSVPEKIDHHLVTPCRVGDNWVWDDISFRILHPQQAETLRGNNLSCTLQVTYGNHSILLTGDIEHTAERRLVARYGSELKSDVLVAPHHGSNTSSSRVFVEAVKPRYVLFPVGYRNRFNFPKKDIIAAYRAVGAELLDTAASGAIEIEIDEAGIDVSRYRQRLRRFWHTEH